MDLRLLDELEDDLVEDIIIQELLDRRSHLGSIKRMRTSMPGHDYIHELLESGNYEQIHQVLRMRYGTFMALRDWLLAQTALKSTKEMTVEEKLAIFLHIVRGIRSTLINLSQASGGASKTPSSSFQLNPYSFSR